MDGGLPTYTATAASAAAPRNTRQMSSDPADQAIEQLGTAFQGIGREITATSDAADTFNAQFEAKGAAVYQPDGSLAPLDLKEPSPPPTRAYNAYRVQAYTAEIETQASLKAKELADQNPQNPDGFASAFKAWGITTAQGLDPTIANEMAMRISDVGQ